MYSIVVLRHDKTILKDCSYRAESPCISLYSSQVKNRAFYQKCCKFGSTMVEPYYIEQMFQEFATAMEIQSFYIE